VQVERIVAAKSITNRMLSAFTRRNIRQRSYQVPAGTVPLVASDMCAVSLKRALGRLSVVNVRYGTR
jgi:hypothetical protein